MGWLVAWTPWDTQREEKPGSHLTVLGALLLPRGPGNRMAPSSCFFLWRPSPASDFYKAWASENKGSEFLYSALAVGEMILYTPNAKEYYSSGDPINTYWLNWVLFQGTKRAKQSKMILVNSMLLAIWKHSAVSNPHSKLAKLLASSHHAEDILHFTCIKNWQSRRFKPPASRKVLPAEGLERLSPLSSCSVLSCPLLTHACCL